MYVLHWVDRSTLTRTVCAIDGLVGDGGLLILGDFLPDYPQRRRYHHLPDEDLYTFKQDYPALFTGLGLYRKMARLTYDQTWSQLGRHWRSLAHPAVGSAPSCTNR